MASVESVDVIHHFKFQIGAFPVGGQHAVLVVFSEKILKNLGGYIFPYADDENIVSP